MIQVNTNKQFQLSTELRVPGLQLLNDVFAPQTLKREKFE